jgi:hypothetical protein
VPLDRDAFDIEVGKASSESRPIGTKSAKRKNSPSNRSGDNTSIASAVLQETVGELASVEKEYFSEKMSNGIREESATGTSSRLAELRVKVELLNELGDEE